MKKTVYRFCLSAFLCWFVATFGGQFLEMPAKVVGITAFVPPVLGLMWGLPAACGVYVGGLLTVTVLNDYFIAESNVFERLMYFVWAFWLFIAAYLPYFLWHRFMVFSKRHAFYPSVHTLKKFLAIMFITFCVTSTFRTFMAPPPDLILLADWIDAGRMANSVSYWLACFTNDFFIAIFIDLAWFFFLVSREYPFHSPDGIIAKSNKVKDEQAAKETERAWLIAMIFYLLFPFGIFYLDKFQIYGMDDLKTWLHFIVECLSMIDVYLVLMLYLMLRYRRSIMMEIVFLVTQTVFFSATVLGWGSSVAMTNLVESHTSDSLHAMSVICRERLYRTFFCVRQAVNGMKLQALNSLENYNRLANDAAYRTNYLNQMKNNFNSIAVGTDGVIAVYFRLIPEIDGTQGGFSMQRKDVRWEGALPPFIERQPIDLAPYSPLDKNVGWYYIPMRSRTATWIEPYVDPIAKTYVISYVAPLFVEGKFIGVVGMDIDFNFIIQELRRMSIYNYGYVYLMNRNDLVLYHKEQRQGLPFRHNEEFEEIELYLANGMWLGIATPLSEVHRERNETLMHLIAAIIFVAMLISLVSIALASKAIKPLAGMTEAAKRIASGDLNVKISYESGNELGILVRSIREMAEKLETYVYRDKLTGLRNAAAYMSKGRELDAQSKLIPDLAYAVVLFDVNFLKKVNDKHGHQAGNQLLRHASRVICRVFQNSPVYRVGGDEFTAILEQEDYENRQALLKLFDEKIAEESFVVNGETIFVSVARGLAIYEEDMDFAAVAKKADVAMYNHKSAIKAKYGEEVR